MSSYAKLVPVPALKNILFPTDFSPPAQAILPFVRSLAERYGSTIHVLHVLAPEPMLEIPLDSVSELDADRDAAQSAMRTLLASKGFRGVAHTATVKRGPLWKVLETFIEQNSIDLIVLATHGRRGLVKLVLGSVAEQVFRLARSPVLTLGPKALHEGAADASFARILFATDFSSGSQRALEYALRFTRANNSHLILLHAISASMEVVPDNFDNVGTAALKVSDEFIADTLASSRRQVAELISDEVMQEFNPEIIVECGPAVETILRVAENKRADLIVMGAHRAPMSSIVTHLPWATASAVVCQAHCPTLTVRS
jgi:nucleotide-binding universal stress UspA family protein